MKSLNAIMRVSGSALFTGMFIGFIAFLSCACQAVTPPSPYVVVFSNTVADMADEYKDVVQRTSTIEENAAIMRVSDLPDPNPYDYEILDTISPFLQTRMQILDVLTSYANLLTGIMTAHDTDKIVLCVALMTSANQLKQIDSDTDIKESFLAVVKYAAEELDTIHPGDLVKEIMERAQPAVEEIVLELRVGYDELGEKLDDLTSTIHRDVLRIRGSPDLSWTERERLDRLAFSLVKMSNRLRADLERLDIAVEELPVLHNLVATNVYKSINAERVVKKLSFFGRAPEMPYKQSQSQEVVQEYMWLK